MSSAFHISLAGSPKDVAERGSFGCNRYPPSKINRLFWGQLRSEWTGKLHSVSSTPQSELSQIDSVMNYASTFHTVQPNSFLKDFSKTGFSFLRVATPNSWCLNSLNFKEWSQRMQQSSLQMWPMTLFSARLDLTIGVYWWGRMLTASTSCCLLAVPLLVLLDFVWSSNGIFRYPMQCVICLPWSFHLLVMMTLFSFI